MHWLGLRWLGPNLVVCPSNLARIARNQLGGIGVRSVDQQLNRRIDATRNIPAKMLRNDQRCASHVGRERLVGLPVGGPGNDVERERFPESSDEFTGGRR